MASQSTPASAQVRAVRILTGLMEEIALLRAEVVRKETAARGLEQSLRGELFMLEIQHIAARTEIFRILGRHLRDAWLPRKSGNILRQAVVGLADELEAEYGADLGTERRVYLGIEDEEEAEERAIYGGRRPVSARRADSIGADFFAGTEGGSGSDSHGKPRSARKRGAKDQALAGDIRALYLILARALHPDKEANPALRVAKTVWMQKVTSAYAKKDLGLLLDILARNPLEAVGPYLSEAPLRTLRGFAKRLRRELTALRILAAKAGGWVHPGFADEARITRHIADLKRLVKLSRQRATVYRTRAGVEELVEGLKRHPWQDLL